MPTTVQLLSALLAAVVLGAAATAFVWRVYRQRLLVQAGVRALAAMRWREFSEFVVTALQQHGFDAHPLSENGSQRDPGDLLLTRDNRSWLLTCKQSAEFVVTSRHVEDMAAAARKRAAAGGVIASLGRTDVPARDVPDGIEVLDGPALWNLISPLLPIGLQEHVADEARANVRRLSASIGVATLLVGLGAGFALGTLSGPEDASSPAPASQAPLPAATAPTTAGPGPASASGTAPAAPDPAVAAPDEDAARAQVIELLRASPDIESASWPSRSTLLVVPHADAKDPRPAICAVVERFEAIRASRVQVQPAPGSTAGVRFFHCRVY